LDNKGGGAGNSFEEQVEKLIKMASGGRKMKRQYFSDEFGDGTVKNRAFDVHIEAMEKSGNPI
jgi:hypothetical protein